MGKYKKKKVKPGLIELHANSSIIIVHYEIQYLNFEDDGITPILMESQISHKKLYFVFL